MISLRYIACCSVAILILAIGCKGKEWHGIVPMHSTKADVTRLLGPPVETNDIRSIYQLGKEDVYIVFSGVQFCDHKTTKVPAGTVLLVQVTPRLALSIADLQLDQGGLKEFSPSLQDPDWKGFIDEEQGLIVRSFKEKIDKIFYIASTKDRALCPSYYAEPEAFARIVVDFTPRVFDQYSDLAFVYEKARLDNFAIYLQKDQPTWKAYVILYPSTDGVSDAQSRAERAKQYLISLGLNEKRISIVVGGLRNKPTTELYALPANLPAPTPNPPATKPDQ